MVKGWSVDGQLYSEETPMRIRRARRATPRRIQAQWDSSHVYHKGERFFAALEDAIDKAHKSIDLESYTFATDRLGERILSALTRAARRGVRVRVLVDGIGSSTWTRTLRTRAAEAKILFKVYHELPWERWWYSKRAGSTWGKLFNLLRLINSRNHRKVCIIDSQQAFVGSMNIIDNHVTSVSGAKAWRDTGVFIEGADVKALVDTFEGVWLGSFRRLKLKLRLKGRRAQSSELIRLNTRRRQRQDNYLDLLVRIVGSRTKVWITNAYFIPDGSLLRALSVAAQGGTDVRILVPHFSDIVFIPWVAAAFHLGLLRAGVRVFEYTGAVLHAKTMLVDEWGLVGSSNLNHRSLLHDLEADVVLPQERDRVDLERQFLIDLKSASEVTIDNWQQRPWIERCIGRILLAFRYML